MRSIIAAAIAALLALCNQASADGWGTIKGQVILDEPIKPAVELAITKDQMHCLDPKLNPLGKILSEEYVIDPKTKGVRWVMVWIAVENNGKANHVAKPPIHQGAAAANKPGVIDQPCCKFEPHMLGIVKGQDFVGKN